MTSQYRRVFILSGRIALDLAIGNKTSIPSIPFEGSDPGQTIEKTIEEFNGSEQRRWEYTLYMCHNVENVETQLKNWIAKGNDIGSRLQIVLDGEKIIADNADESTGSLLCVIHDDNPKIIITLLPLTINILEDLPPAVSQIVLLLVSSALAKSGSKELAVNHVMWKYPALRALRQGGELRRT